ncbi:bifunctional DNA primase/polymerase [Poseidonocella sp. HB161398]|uniref:bifunctional DNA primase/polymerase n=1 Tax=Poseidonocella sp. HB161398 TaxID=2320855 RepID=UPI00110851A4|nr:bifunctional DNA primase/polymerase [Poseidonocella sp. HB161398]
MDRLEAALQYYERGWAIIPIHPETKKPTVKWKDYQTSPPTEEQLEAWWTKWPDAEMAIITGAVSGLVVVDCDSPDALEAARALGWHSPIQVRTKRGRHFYFEHPRDGEWRGPAAGSTTRGVRWPKVPGLDFRGDGSYALLPPSTGYEWDVPSGLAAEDDAPMWEDWTPPVEELAPGEFDLGALDLTDLEPSQPGEYLTEWERTRTYIREHFPETGLVPTGQGNGRNERVMRAASDAVMAGCFGEPLRVRVRAFMDEFFEDHLEPEKFEATCRSMEEAERRNHPERFDADGKYIPREESVSLPAPEASEEEEEEEEEEEPAPQRLIRMEDRKALQERAAATTFLIEPWLPPRTIVQVYGYSGHGKSLFVQHALAALASGQPTFGPFGITTPARVLYLDFENGMATLGRRLDALWAAHGDTGDRLNIWTPFLTGEAGINLRSADGLSRLKKLCNENEPDVVVIDTIRSAFPGLQENASEDWARVNQIALALRNAGASVIMLHHANKPGESGVGREAGNTNQLTVLETQIRVAQVFKSEDEAKLKAGIHDETYPEPIWPRLEAKTSDLGRGWRLLMVCEVRYGKVREWSDNHDPVQWIGYAANDDTGEHRVVSSLSTRQRAVQMHRERGIEPHEIAAYLNRPMSVVNHWLGITEDRSSPSE